MKVCCAAKSLNRPYKCGFPARKPGLFEFVAGASKFVFKAVGHPANAGSSLAWRIWVSASSDPLFFARKVSFFLAGPTLTSFMLISYIINSRVLSCLLNINLREIAKKYIDERGHFVVKWFPVVIFGALVAAWRVSQFCS